MSDYHIRVRPGAIPWREYRRDVWQHRDLFRTFALRDLKLRYRQTVLGATWVVVQPLLGAGVLSFIFGNVAGLPTDGIPGFLFTFGSMLFWQLFLASVSRMTSSFVSNSSLVAKIFFPRVILPLSSSMSALLDFAVAGVLLIGMIVVEGITPGLTILLLPLFVLLSIMLASGLGLVLGSLAVPYRDVLQITPVALQLLFYLSPVAYSSAAVPEKYQTLYHLNPMAGLLEAFRWALFGTKAPETGHLVWAVSAACLSLVVGVLYLRQAERRFPDVI